MIEKLALWFLFILPLFFGLASCEGYRCGNGRVVDKLTNKPLDSVLCEVLNGTRTMYTDSSGQFELCDPIGKCVPDCKNITIRFFKAGYKQLSVENPTGETVYLEQ